MNKPVTIITSAYASKEEFLVKLVHAVRKQKYRGKVSHIIINDNPKRKISIPGVKVINHSKSRGLASVLNEGFKMAKTEYIVSLMDDCLPSSNSWLSTLLEPLKERQVAATTSNVELPREFWNNFGYFAKALTEKEQRIITPGLDEKGCAYKKTVLREFGFLNDREFRNGGEDTDLTVKIEQSKWKIVNTMAKVYHYHHFTFNSRLKKEIQYAQLSGLVSRKHFFNLPWNFQAHVSAKILIGILFIYSLLANYSILLSSILVFLISNLRLPSQIKRLGKDARIFLIPFVNLLVYFAYFTNYLYALLFKPTV